MLTLKEKILCNLIHYKSNTLIRYACHKKLVRLYNDEEINKLRENMYYGLPSSIILLSREYCRGKCEEMAKLFSNIFRDYDNLKLVYAEVDSITYNKINIESLKDENGILPEKYGLHVFIEYKDKNNITWVYDTTDGLVYEKNLYYLIQRPKIDHILEKEEILRMRLSSIGYKVISNNDDSTIKEKILSFICANLDSEIYEEELRKEIELYKGSISPKNLSFK